MQHGAVGCPSLVAQSLGSLAWLTGFKAFLVLSSHIFKHFPALTITTNSLLHFIDKPSHFQGVACPWTRAGRCSAGIGHVQGWACLPPLDGERTAGVCRWAPSCLWFAPSRKVNPRSQDTPPDPEMPMAEVSVGASKGSRACLFSASTFIGCLLLQPLRGYG